MFNMFKNVFGTLAPETDQFGMGMYDPKAAQRAAVGGVLKGLGVGLASNDWGRAAEMAGTGVEDYERSVARKSALQDLMFKAEENRRKREEEQKRNQWMEQQIAQLPADQQALARMMPDKYFGNMLDAQFQTESGDQYFGTPIPFDMGDGRIGYGLPSKSGGFKALDAPGGAAFLGPYDKAFQNASGAARGKITTEQEMSAPGDLQAAEQALGLIDQIVSHPAIELGTGFSSYGNAVRGTPGYDFQNLVEQAKSGAFLTAIDQLKGMGALSNMEGQAATAAVTRMDTATSQEAFLKAVDDYRKIVDAGRQRAAARMGQPTAETAPAAPKRLRYNPETGELE